MEQTRCTNKHYLDPLMLKITYESTDIISQLEGTRKYTYTHGNICVGSKYYTADTNKYILGEWIKENGKYQIHIDARYIIIDDDDISIMLESIAFAETSLLENNPMLAGTRIFVKYQDEKVEYFHRLGHWTMESMKKSYKKKEKKKKQTYERRAPLQCEMCKR